MDSLFRYSKLCFNITNILFQNYSEFYTNTYLYPCNIKRNSDILWQLSLASERSGKMLHGGLATNDIFSFWKPSCCCCRISIIFLQSSCRHTFKDHFWLITTRKRQEEQKEGYNHKLLSSEFLFIYTKIANHVFHHSTISYLIIFEVRHSSIKFYIRWHRTQTIIILLNKLKKRIKPEDDPNKSWYCYWGKW